MRSIEDHLAATRDMLPDVGVETLSVTPELAGRTLASDIMAASDLPPFDNSQMDGYAVPAGHSAGEITVGETIPAGTDPDELYPQGLTDQAVPVMTGAKLPGGTAAVVAVEHCSPAEFVDPGASIRLPEITPQQFVRPRGSDIARGQLLLVRDTRLTPAGIATLVSQSIPAVEVYRRASVLIVTGGAEVGSVGAASIPDSNAPMLAALCQRHGIDVAGFVRTNDDPEALREGLQAAVDKHRPTAVVTSGGISAGKFEVVRQVLSDGWFGHVDQQPGGPQGLSTFAATPVISLPGNPVSTLVSFRMFIAPLLGQAPQPVTAQLAEAREGLSDERDQLLRGHLSSRRDGTLVATPTGGTSSHLLSQAATADCLIRIPARAALTPGAAVTVYPL